MPTVRRKTTKDQRSAALQQATPLDDGTLTTPVRVGMIQALISLGLKAVEEALVREATALAGSRYGPTDTPFDAVRLHTSAAKRFKRVENATALIWKLLLVAEHQFRKLNAPHLCHEVYTDTPYRDGVRVAASSIRASRGA